MKKILYLGLNAPSSNNEIQWTHCPLIKIIPENPQKQTIQMAYEGFDKYTHLLFTSKNSVEIFFEYAKLYEIALDRINKKISIAVGKKTAEAISKKQSQAAIIAFPETAEGMIVQLRQLDLKNAYLFWPHSALARPLLKEWLENHQIKYQATIFYTTITQPSFPLPSPSEYDEIVFTSPSTVNAFIEIFKQLPKNIPLTSIGSITQAHLEAVLTQTE